MERAGILVELTVVTPLIVIMLMGIIGIGLAYRQQILLFESVRVAGRALADEVPAAATGSDGSDSFIGQKLCADAVSITQTVLSSSGLNPADYVITVRNVDLSQDSNEAAFSLCGSLEFNGASIQISPTAGFLKFFSGVITRGSAITTVPLQSRVKIKDSPC